MLNTININLKTDIKTDRPATLPIKLMSQDKNNNQFILRFTNGGESVALDDTYTVEVLTKFSKSGTSRLTTAKVRQDYATWEFDTAYIAQDETVYNYVYVRKSGNLVVSADANCFVFSVDLSEIDKGAGKVAETYDENYEKYLDEFKNNVDFEEIAQAEQARKEAEILREESYEQKVDTAIVEADVVEKVDNKVTELTPRINDLTAQLAHNANKANERIDDTNDRINDIITTPAEGISEQEIIDARQTETSLGANLTKIKESIFTSAENLVANPLFQNGNEKWTPSGSSLESSGGVLSMISNAGTNSAMVYTDIPFPTNEKIYFLIRIKPIHAGVSSIRVQAQRHGSAVTEQIDSPAIGEEHTLSLIAKKTMDTYSYVRLLSYSIHSSLSANTKTIELSKPLALNLTRIFGVGKEPTKEEMDNLMKMLPFDFWEDDLRIDTLEMFNRFVNAPNLNDYMATNNESWVG